MERVYVEESVPYEQSRVWGLQDAYFAKRGLLAWDDGDIPFGATSNAVLAAQHVRFLAGQLHGDGPVAVLEIGGGNGEFARQFLKRLHAGRSAAVRALAARLVYVLTDVWVENLRNLAEEEPFRGAIARGRLVLATFDVRAPDRLLDLAGQPLDLAPGVVIANYLACNTPTRVLHKSPLGWLERWVRLCWVGDGAPPSTPDGAWERVVAEAGRLDGLFQRQVETSWRPTSPTDGFSTPIGQGVIDVLSELREGTVAVPYAFLDLMNHWVGRRGALALVTDFGRAGVHEMRGPQARDPVVYGGCLSHPVDFPLFDHWGAHSAIDVMRTTDPLRMVHVVALRPMADDQAAFVTSFRGVYGNREVEDFLDLRVSAREAFLAKDYPRAARMARRALQADPDAPDLLYRFGWAMIRAGAAVYAVHALRRGRRVTRGGGVFDFDHALGRAYLAVGDVARAVPAFRRSMRLRPSSHGAIDLARALDARGDRIGAQRVVEQAVNRWSDDPACREWLAWFEGARPSPPPAPAEAGDKGASGS